MAIKKSLICVAALSLARVTHSAEPPQPPLPPSTPSESAFALAVLDSRPDVVSGERQETFVGLSRSLYGIPYPEHTPSKKPLAQVFAAMIARALQDGGIPTDVVTVSPYRGTAGALDSLKATGASRLLLLEVRDWWSDKLIRTELHHDLKLTVFDNQGRELGTSTSVGHDELGKRQRPERRDVGSATNDILSTLVVAPPVLAAFSSTADPVASPSRTCTVEQVLKMNDAGLTQAQIEAACGSG